MPCVGAMQPSASGQLLAASRAGDADTMKAPHPHAFRLKPLRSRPSLYSARVVWSLHAWLVIGLWPIQGPHTGARVLACIQIGYEMTSGYLNLFDGSVQLMQQSQ